MLEHCTESHDSEAPYPQYTFDMQVTKVLRPWQGSLGATRATSESVTVCHIPGTFKFVFALGLLVVQPVSRAFS